MTTDRQCPSCGGFCKKSGCERENVQPEQRSEQWWKHEVSNAFAQGYEKGRLQREWQGLTDEDREAIALLVEKMGMEGYGTLAIAAAIRKGEM